MFVIYQLLKNLRLFKKYKTEIPVTSKKMCHALGNFILNIFDNLYFNFKFNINATMNVQHSVILLCYTLSTETIKRAVLKHHNVIFIILLN